MGFRVNTGIKSGMRAVLAVGFPAFPISPLWAEDVPIWAEDVPIWAEDVPIWGQDVPCASLVPFVPSHGNSTLKANSSNGLDVTLNKSGGWLGEQRASRRMNPSTVFGMSA